MDSLDREFALLAASAERTARVQRAEVVHFLKTAPRAKTVISSESQAPDVPYSESTVDLEPRSGIVLAGQMLAAYDTLLAYVAQQRTEYNTLPGKAAKHGAITEMRKLVAGVRDLHRSLSWLDAARNPPLDLGTRYFVDEIVAQLISPEAELTVVAGERSYGKMSNPFSPVFALTGNSTPEGLAIVVFIPRREKKSGLLHPLIVHEIGHAANDQHGLVARILSATSGDPEFERTKTRTAESIGGKAPEELAAATESINHRLSSWVEEALCDALGAQLLGPTYLYAFMAIVGTSNLDRGSQEHPSTRQRIQLLLRQLDSAGWKPLMRDEVPEVDGWFREAAEITRAYPDPEEEFCAQALDNVADLVRLEVKKAVAGLTFRATEYSAFKQEIGELLDAGLPPSQTVTGNQIGRASIILGSWLFGIHAMGDDLAALAQAADIPQISHLLPKALQDGALLAAWSAT